MITLSNKCNHGISLMFDCEDCQKNPTLRQFHTATLGARMIDGKPHRVCYRDGDSVVIEKVG